MAENNGDISSLTSEQIEGFSPEQATNLINATLGEALQDEDHPYTSHGHPHHKIVVERMSKLYGIKNKGKLDPVAQTCQDALDGKAIKDTSAQTERTAEAKQLIKELNTKGYDYTTDTFDVDKIPEWFLIGLRQQRQRESSNRVGLAADLVRDLRKYGAPSDADLIKALNRVSDLFAIGSNDSPVLGILDAALIRVHNLRKDYFSRFDGSAKIGQQ